MIILKGKTEYLHVIDIIEFAWKNIPVSYICENASLCDHAGCGHRERHEGSVYCHSGCSNTIPGSKCEVFKEYGEKHEKRNHNKFRSVFVERI